MDKLKNTRILGAIGIVCLFFGTTLPYVTFKILGRSANITLWGYWEGKIMMILIIFNALFIFRDYVEKYIPQLFDSSIGRIVKNMNDKFAIMPTILIVIFAVYVYSRLNIASKYMSFGIGFYILCLGVISLVLYTILYKKKENTPSINNIENQYVTNPINEYNNVKYCSSCGNQNNENAAVCFMCGNKL